MPLSTEFNAASAAITLACGATAAAMHWAAVAGSAHVVPARQFRANLLAATVGGMIAAQALDLIPVVQITPLVAILIAAITGHALGPRALWFFGVAMVKAAQKRGVEVPDLPPPEPEPPTAPPEVSPPEVKDG